MVVRNFPDLRRRSSPATIGAMIPDREPLFFSVTISSLSRLRGFISPEELHPPTLQSHRQLAVPKRLGIGAEEILAPAREVQIACRNLLQIVGGRQELGGDAVLLGLQLQ